MYMFIGKYNRSLVVTYLGVILSVLGMYFSFMGNYNMAIIFLVMAGICDMFDGKIARACKRTEEEKAFGIQIDSLADIVNFIVFPVIIGLSLGLKKYYCILGYCLYVMAGIERLAYFNVTVEGIKSEKPIKSYSGLPVTSSAIIFPLAWLITRFVKAFTFKSIFIPIMFICSVLFILNIKVPKFKGIAYPIITIIAILGIIALLMIR